MIDRLRGFFSGLFGGETELDEEAAEKLRIAFKARYHQFQLLLTANRKALDTMADIEEALDGVRPFGMAFVREWCTRVSTDVYRIIKHLDELSGGKYKRLRERFEAIQAEIKPHLERRSPKREGPLVLPLTDVSLSHASQVGSKMANLGEILNRLGLRVPRGFVITARGYQRFMEHNDLQPEIDRRVQRAERETLEQRYALSDDVRRLIMDSEVPEDLAAAILENYRLLDEEDGSTVTLAMRSSALGEDSAGKSAAGQYHSELNVHEDRILAAYKEIVASKHSPPAMIYRLSRGIRDVDVAMCVGCLRMVASASGGVLYTRNPIDFRDDAVVINSVWGLPKSVVDGSTAPDTFIVDRTDPPTLRYKEVPIKEHLSVLDDKGGVRQEDLSEGQGGTASLTDAQVLELTNIAIRLEDYYRAPQDVEWTITEDGGVAILQCRPLQQVEAPRKPKGDEAPAKRRSGALLEGGVAASPGAAAGPVYAVKRDSDAPDFPDGAVLVVAQALPRWAALLGRASAVIARQGSVASHLANVAREFGVPALFGLRDAFKLLENRTQVTVDADGRAVYAGRVEDLLRDRPKPKNLMKGSRVYEAMKNASEHIVPLTLLDPDSIQFRPRNCKTLHDITRFCHERSVTEMFRFGRDHSFPERSSKQLVAEVPMKWWVLNLDDGFKSEVEGKHVRIENISSIPMLALWDGITRYPWEGPPPIDAKGFMSVMFQATANTSLTPGARSAYADRNYFMISKNYCSLSSRLGFHFAITEALVSDRHIENYISFQFKGGAADFDRRQRRVYFIKDILEEHDFRIQVREDNLIARIEDLERDQMERRLRVVGYLSIHTRQLDMIMADEDSTIRFREKITREISTMLD